MAVMVGIAHADNGVKTTKLSAELLYLLFLVFQMFLIGNIQKAASAALFIS